MHELLVQYFAAARELAGCSEERLSLPERELDFARLRALLAVRHPRLAPFLERMRFAINDDLSAQVERVQAGDRVAVLPPVAGGSASIREAPLSVDEAIAAVAHPGAGAIALFLGVVRDCAEQGQVARLDYEAHRALAEQELGRIVQELAREQPGVRVCVHHRVGSLAIGELAVVVAASAAHRAEAFTACREVIERVKARVPIWKKEWAPDGSALWVNLGG